MFRGLSPNNAVIAKHEDAKLPKPFYEIQYDRDKMVSINLNDINIFNENDHPMYCRLMKPGDEKLGLCEHVVPLQSNPNNKFKPIPSQCGRLTPYFTNYATYVCREHMKPLTKALNEDIYMCDHNKQYGKGTCTSYAKHIYGDFIYCTLHNPANNKPSNPTKKNNSKQFLNDTFKNRSIEPDKKKQIKSNDIIEHEVNDNIPSIKLEINNNNNNNNISGNNIDENNTNTYLLKRKHSNFRNYTMDYATKDNNINININPKKQKVKQPASATNLSNKVYNIPYTKYINTILELINNIDFRLGIVTRESLVQTMISYIYLTKRLNH